MNPEIDRFRELGRLIRRARTELSARQTELIEAYERELDPVDLAIHIAQLGRQISLWKREREILFRRIAWDEETVSVSSAVCSLVLDRLNERDSSMGA